MGTELQPFENIDYNKVIAEFVNIKINEITSLTTSAFSGIKKDLKVRLKAGYSNYLTNLTSRYGKSRSVFIRDEPKNLYSFYVPIGLQANEIVINNANLRAIQGVNLNAIICGSAGSGKSILLKHLLINSLRDKKFIPIFIELRDLNTSSKSLFGFIQETFEEFNIIIEETYLHKSFLDGQFVVFLDGLDEVITNRRTSLIKEIDKLQKKYVKCSIIITSRPDHDIAGLQTFSVLHSMPLNLEQSIDLINKLPAEEQTKTKFIADLRTSLFVKHSSFLSNPLLLSIMLLTYGYSVDIPSKLSIFYDQAYEALFQRHDAFKGAYKRERETELDIKEFSKVFSAFCIQTYDERKFQFSKSEALMYIERAKTLSNLDFNIEKYLIDILRSVCLLIEDGLFIEFTHRSFQEYFAALFIVESNSTIKKRLLKKYQTYTGEDNIYKLVYELDQEFLEFEVILPFINDLFSKIELTEKIEIPNFLSFIKIMWKNFTFRNGKFMATVNQKEGMNGMVRFIVPDISSKKFKNLINKQKRSDWINLMIEKSKKDKKAIIFDVNHMKVEDDIVKQLYDHAQYFSKIVLEILMSTKNNIQSKRSSNKENLESILFK